MVILHWSLLFIFISEVPPSEGNETNDVETSNKEGSGSLELAHDIIVVTHKIAINIVLLKKNLILILILVYLVLFLFLFYIILNTRFV
ncbi:hypothetical protein D3C84_1031400 [compost metagenome]